MEVLKGGGGQLGFGIDKTLVNAAALLVAPIVTGKFFDSTGGGKERLIEQFGNLGLIGFGLLDLERLTVILL